MNVEFIARENIMTLKNIAKNELIDNISYAKWSCGDNGKGNAS